MAFLVRQPKAVQGIDINILPQEYRRRLLSGRTLFLVLLVLALAFALYSLYPLRAEAVSHVEKTQALFKNSQQQIKSLQGSDAKVKELKEALAKLEERRKIDVADWELFQKRQFKWHSALQAVISIPPPRVTLNSIEQKASQMTIRGIAPDQAAVVAYANALHRSGPVSDASISFVLRKEGDLAFEILLSGKVEVK